MGITCKMVGITLFWFVRKDKKRIKYAYLRVNRSLKLLVKPLLHSAFSLITLIPKLYIKQPVERPHQIFTIHGTFVEKHSNCLEYFLRLSGFPDLSGEIFLITFKLSYLDYLTTFRKSNVNKAV